MNINMERKTIIWNLYKSGVSIHDISIVSGMTEKTIASIVKTQSDIETIINEIRKLAAVQ